MWIVFRAADQPPEGTLRSGDAMTGPAVRRNLGGDPAGSWRRKLCADEGASRLREPWPVESSVRVWQNLPYGVLNLLFKL
jgi:hypothetical protein